MNKWVVEVTWMNGKYEEYFVQSEKAAYDLYYSFMDNPLAKSGGMTKLSNITQYLVKRIVSLFR